MTNRTPRLLKSGACRAARIGASAVLALSTILWSTPGHTDDASGYPNRPVRLIVPWPVGGIQHAAPQSARRPTDSTILFTLTTSILNVAPTQE